MLRSIMLWFGICLLSFSVSARGHHKNFTTEQQYEKDIQHIVNKLTLQRHFDLLHYFDEANMPYPPRKLALLVFKKEKTLEVWASDGKHWAFIRDMPVLAASGKPGPKLHVGDKQVPEGIYHIRMLNPYSKYDLSLMIDYPDTFDKVHARMDHRRRLGGNIFIHGGHLSVGCVAIGDHAIEDLFVMVHHVGPENVSVIIAPNDMRRTEPLIARRHPWWISELNNQLKHALNSFTGKAQSQKPQAKVALQSRKYHQGVSERIVARF